MFCDGEAVSAGFALTHGCHRSAVARCLSVVVESADGRDIVVGDLRVGPFQVDEAAVRVVAPTCHVRDADVPFRSMFSVAHESSHSIAAWSKRWRQVE